jgi:hypothetical protein
MLQHNNNLLARMQGQQANRQTQTLITSTEESQIKSRYFKKDFGLNAMIQQTKKK